MYCIEFVVDHGDSQSIVITEPYYTEYPTQTEIKELIDQTIEERNLKGQVVRIAVMIEN